MGARNKKQDVLVKLICLLLSFGLWIYISNVENPTITRTIRDVEVTILNEDVLANSKLIMLPNQTFKVNLAIQGTSSDVYAVKPEDFQLSVDLSSYALKKGDNIIPINIEKAPSSVNIKQTETLKVTVTLDDLAEKSIPIKTDVNVSSKKGTYPSTPVVDPVNANISGPAQYVDEVDSVVASGEAKNVENDVVLTLNLVAMDKNERVIKEVTIDPVTANVSIPIKKGKTVPVSIKTKGSLNSNLLMKSMEASPTNVEITGEEAALKNITSVDTEAIDLSLITTSKDIMANLKLPEGISLASNTNEAVTIKFSIEGISQKTINVPVTVNGVGDGLSASLDKESVSITIQGPSNILDGISELTGEIDASNLGEGTSEVAPNIKLKDGVTMVSLSPDKLKLTIEKKVS